MTEAAVQVNPSEEDPLRTVEYVAKVTNFKEYTVRDWLRTGKLEGVKIQGEWRIAHSELVRFVNEKWGDGQ